MASAAPPAVSHHESLRAKPAERVRLRNQANHPYARNETQLCAPSQQHQQQQPQQPKPQPQQRGKSNQPTQSSQVRSSITPLIAPRERGARKWAYVGVRTHAFTGWGGNTREEWQGRGRVRQDETRRCIQLIHRSRLRHRLRLWELPTP